MIDAPSKRPGWLRAHPSPAAGGGWANAETGLAQPMTTMCMPQDHEAVWIHNVHGFRRRLIDQMAATATTL